MDRNYLMKRVQDAISIAEMNTLRAKDEQVTQPYDDSSEYQSSYGDETTCYV